MIVVVCFMKSSHNESSLHPKYSFQNTSNDNHFTPQDNIILVTNRKDFKTFFKIPWNIYRNNTQWAQPLWNEFNNFFQMKNPFWNHAEAALFITYKDNKPVGRIASIIDHLYCKHVGKKIGYFGFFECINDYEQAKSLLKTAENWLATKGIEEMQGPIDGRVDKGCGLLYKGFQHQQSLLSSYSPPYYVSFMENYNMKKKKDLISYSIDLTKPLPEILRKKAEKCMQSPIKIRHFNRLQSNKELDWWINLFLKTFTEHWGFVPVSAEEVKSRFGIKQMRWIVDPRLFLIAEINNEPVAYLWATPDYNQLLKKMNGNLTFLRFLTFLSKKNQINRGILHLIGIDKKIRHHHLASCLNYQVLTEMRKRGYRNAEVGWIEEDNAIAHQTISLTGAKISKKYRVFQKKLGQTESNGAST